MLYCRELDLIDKIYRNSHQMNILYWKTIRTRIISSLNSSSNVSLNESFLVVLNLCLLNFLELNISLALLLTNVLKIMHFRANRNFDNSFEMYFSHYLNIFTINPIKSRVIFVSISIFSCANSLFCNLNIWGKENLFLHS